MVVFNELRITNDGEYLIIDARIRNESIYSNIEIKKVTVGTHKTYEEGASNGKEIPISTLNQATNDTRVKRVYFRLSKLDLTDFSSYEESNEIDLEKDLIYVYIDTNSYDNPDCPDLPCDLTKSHHIGVTMYMGGFYNDFMSYMNELNKSSCEAKVPQGLIDMLLKFTALTTAIDSKHFIKANEFFNKWFTGKHMFNSNSNCGCNG